eukprot:2414564-Amphidinium_carterae.1
MASVQHAQIRDEPIPFGEVRVLFLEKSRHAVRLLRTPLSVPVPFHMSWERFGRILRKIACLQNGDITFAAVEGELPTYVLPGIAVQAFWQRHAADSAQAHMTPGLLAGGGGTSGQGIGRAIAMIKASDCRFTTAQCKGLLTSNKVKAAADKHDQRTLDMLVFSEAKRLGI